MKDTKIFIINSCLCTQYSEIDSYSSMMNVIWNNSGNSYIGWSLLKELGSSVEQIKGRNIPNIYTYNYEESERDLYVINNECTHVVLCLQDQIRVDLPYKMQLPYSNLKIFLRKIKVPILIASLGANNLSGYSPDFHRKLGKDLIDFLQFLSGITCTIGIRGHYTEEILSKIGIRNTHVIGCPTYYETGYDREIIKPLHKKDLNIGTSTACALENISTAIYLQDGQEESFIKAIYFGERDLFSRRSVKWMKKGKYRFFTLIDEWKNSLSTMDFFAGARVHGAIIALNSGVPAVVMNSDSRAREMCEYMNIPYYPELRLCRNVEEILTLCDYDKMNIEYNSKLQDYISFLKENGFIYQPLKSDMGGVSLIPVSDFKAEAIKGIELFKQIYNRVFAKRGSYERARAIELIKF